jgi:Domain of unknown function (DUF4383)
LTEEGASATARSSPAKVYAGLVGATLVVTGIIGFFYSSSFGSPGDVEAVFGILDVNGWQNVVHIVTGALGLMAFGVGGNAARQCALAFGVVYVIVAAWGFVVGSGDQILGIIPVNTGDNVVHLLLGIAGLAAGLATAEVGRAAPAGPATT